MSIQPTGPARQLSLFEKALAGAAVVETVFTQNMVLKSENKPALVGIPFVITKITFQLPDEEMADNDVKDYVSLECQIAPGEFVEQNIKRKVVPYQGSLDGWIESYGYQPGDYLVINDGSKGIRRQVVKALHADPPNRPGLIDIGARTGADADFDRPWSEWVRWEQSEQHKQDGEPVDVPCFTKGSHGDDLVIPVLMGLRESRDPDAPKSHSSTFYLS